MPAPEHEHHHGRGLLGRVVERISDHPRLFMFCRGVLEGDFKEIRARIRTYLRPGTGLRSLDLGCGPGAFAPLFAGDDYYGVDINPRYVEHARRTQKGTFLASDARKVDLPASRFDQVLIFGLLHHLSDEAASRVLAEAFRLLAGGGRILAIEDIPTRSRLNLIGHLIHRVENGDFIRPVDDYRRLYSSHGTIDADEVLQSGICDYYAAVLRR